MTALASIVRRLPWILFIRMVLVATCIAYLIFLIRHDYYLTDFIPFFSAAQILRTEPTKLYQMSTQKQYQIALLPSTVDSHLYEYAPFVNPPFFLLPLLPLSALSTKQAYIIVRGLLGILLLLDIVLLYNLFPSLSRITLIIFSLSFAPVYITLVETQSSFISLFIFITIYYFFKNGRFFLAGLISSLLLYKAQIALPLYIYFFFQKNLRLSSGVIIGSVLLISLSLIITHGHLLSFFYLNYWYATVYEAIPSNTEFMISWPGFFSQGFSFMHFLPIRLLSIIASVVTLVWSLLHIGDKKRGYSEFSRVFSIIILTTLISGMHIHYHDAVLLLFPLFFYFQKTPSLKLYLIVALGWVVMLLAYFSPFYPKTVPYLPTLYLLLFLIFAFQELDFIKNSQLPKLVLNAKIKHT